MRKLQTILKTATKTLKIFESKNKIRGEIYENGVMTMAADFYYKDNDATEYRVCEYFNFKNFYRVPFERKNGKIVFFPVNKQRRIIYSNNDYSDWKKAAENSGDYDDEEITYETYCSECEICLDDERSNLKIEVDGYIVAFANLGLWNGRVNAAKIIGTNVKDILYSSCDYVTWYCDVHNVRSEQIHHDGTNYIIYRVAKNKEEAEKLVRLVGYWDMSEEEFRRKTKSLRPYVAKVYGW